MAVISRPSPVTKKVALAVRSVPTPSSAAREAMVSASGVATSSVGSSSSAAGSGTLTRAICWFSA